MYSEWIYRSELDVYLEFYQTEALAGLLCFEFVLLLW